jgi:hypothetical protein
MAAGPLRSANPQLTEFYKAVAKQIRELRGWERWDENLRAVIQLNRSLQGIPPEAISFDEICRLERERQLRSIVTAIDRFCCEVYGHGEGMPNP